MNGAIVFQLPAAWVCLLPLSLLLGWSMWRQRRRGFSFPRIAALTVLRSVPLLGLVFLAARPVRVGREAVGAAARPVLVLMDRSESMSLKEGDSSRYQRAVDFFRRRLAPALKSANLPVKSMLFDQHAVPADERQIVAARPDGKRTNLGGAIAEALSTAGPTPLAVVTLTDGVANEGAEDSRAASALAESGAPFIGVGFGGDEGVQTLSLRRLEAPASVTPRMSFSLSAELQWLNAEEDSGFDLVLFRDGKVVQKKTVKPAKGSRTWLENFQVNGETEGVHEYLAQLLPPNAANFKCLDTSARASVKVTDEKELRVLYIQGALTWDYKFIGLALHDDPALKLTGLTRTSKESVFRQNVESTGELLHGFPASLEEMVPFRVVVLSNVRPADLSPAQQDLLARFCGELGGGVLMLGGADTFDSSWENSRLEQLLPVVFAANPGVSALDQPFHLELTDTAARDPVFQLTEDQPVRKPWSRLPSFSQFGKVDAAKLGAQIWMLHPAEQGPHGRRILMASQRYGAGSSAVICIQNFWRWRLAKDCEPQQYDRFWRQLFRWLGDAGRQEVNIQFTEQELRPQTDVELVLQRQAGASAGQPTNDQFLVQIEDGRKSLLREEALELKPFHPVGFRFRAENPDRYTLKVLNGARTVVAERSIEICDTDVELEQTARSMETLRQWAGLTDGLAFKVEECPQATDLVARIKSKVEQVRQSQPAVRTAGMNWWTLSLILGGLSGEWCLRKRWGLV